MAKAKRGYLKFCRSLCALCLFSGVFFCLRAEAAFDAFLKLKGVDGDVVDSKHSNWIAVTSFTQDTTGRGTQGIGRTSAGLCVTKLLDKASPLLNQRCAAQTMIPAARLELLTVTEARLKFYEINLSNVVVKSVGTVGLAGGSDAESLCLNFERIEWTYTEYDARGTPRNTIDAWWDLVLNVGNNNVTPVLRVSAVQIGPSTIRLSWPAQAGKTYNILGSALVNGTYSFVDSVAVQTTGAFSRDVPMAGGMKFFRVAELP